MPITLFGGAVSELMEHAIQKKYEYRRQWHYGDFVIWGQSQRPLAHRGRLVRRLQLRRRLSVHFRTSPRQRVCESVLFWHIQHGRYGDISLADEDADDLDRLRCDPAFTLACGRVPDSGTDLRSQPTLLRWRTRLRNERCFLPIHVVTRRPPGRSPSCCAQARRPRGTKIRPEPAREALQALTSKCEEHKLHCERKHPDHHPESPFGRLPDHWPSCRNYRSACFARRS
jgi:hypothetical protein